MAGMLTNCPAGKTADGALGPSFGRSAARGSADAADAEAADDALGAHFGAACQAARGSDDDDEERPAAVDSPIAALKLSMIDNGKAVATKRKADEAAGKRKKAAAAAAAQLPGAEAEQPSKKPRKKATALKAQLADEQVAS